MRPAMPSCRELAEDRLRRRGTCTRSHRRREAPRPCRRRHACGGASFRSKTAPGSAAAICASTARIGQSRRRREARSMRCSRPGGRSREPDQRDAPDRGERHHVGQRAVGGPSGLHAERLGEIRQPVRAQPRQGDAHDLQRVEPRAAKRVTSRDALDERAVERRVVRDDVSTADELEQAVRRPPRRSAGPRASRR